MPAGGKSRKVSMLTGGGGGGALRGWFPLSAGGREPYAPQETCYFPPRAQAAIRTAHT